MAESQSSYASRKWNSSFLPLLPQRTLSKWVICPPWIELDRKDESVNIMAQLVDNDAGFRHFHRLPREIQIRILDFHIQNQERGWMRPFTTKNDKPSPRRPVDPRPHLLSLMHVSKDVRQLARGLSHVQLTSGCCDWKTCFGVSELCRRHQKEFDTANLRRYGWTSAHLPLATLHEVAGVEIVLDLPDQRDMSSISEALRSTKNLKWLRLSCTLWTKGFYAEGSYQTNLNTVKASLESLRSIRNPGLKLELETQYSPGADEKDVIWTNHPKEVEFPQVAAMLASFVQGLQASIRSGTKVRQI